jgi:hypothetical protein
MDEGETDAGGRADAFDAGGAGDGALNGEIDAALDFLRGEGARFGEDGDGWPVELRENIDYLAPQPEQGARRWRTESRMSVSSMADQ